MKSLAALAVFLSFASAASACPELLNRDYRTLAGKEPASLCQYEGKVLLIVNTASKCGRTPQYEGLEALHARLQDRDRHRLSPRMRRP